MQTVFEHQTAGGAGFGAHPEQVALRCRHRRRTARRLNGPEWIPVFLRDYLVRLPPG